jgi:hypothetical protein
MQKTPACLLASWKKGGWIKLELPSTVVIIGGE